ncbi:hypothetical protein J8F10_22220 [Gemmata sp. G18]|uniref:Uncharacterized protein n=1 Tax=Gemmata palustris TaxID=2822762 RepID=A0ABS5BXK9_9BACT|nr:hypothetical protein [Gemmata palustris]MBP3957980.1 hypothetical protein [Gemmata palustris]
MPPDRDELEYTWLKRSAPIWLSPRTVAGYDAGDFSSFSPADRDQLTAQVNAFRGVAEAIADREPTAAELKSGLAYLMNFINLLDHLALDAEGRALLLALYRSRITFPDFVLGIDYTLDTDATGDPGIWIWVIVPDDVDPDSSEFRQFSTQFRKEVRRALAEVKSDRLPYIHYRLLSEAVGLMSEGVV